MKKSLYFFIFSITILLLNNTSMDSESFENLPGGYIRADIKLGGLLYDNWPKIKNVKIYSSHPLYPFKNKKKGNITWRCKECHGWDYLGKDGSYSNNLHFTGIKGLYDARDKAPEELYAAITDKMSAHDFTKNLYLSVDDIWALVKFIREGLIDVNTIVSTLGIANGKLDRGRHLYWKQCAECHGADGKKIYFREDFEGTHGIGWEAIADPQETLHKIRWGHPGSDMPSMIADKNLSNKDTIDILTYCQTLYP